MSTDFNSVQVLSMEAPSSTEFNSVQVLTMETQNNNTALTNFMVLVLEGQDPNPPASGRNFFLPTQRNPNSLDENVNVAKPQRIDLSFN